MKAMQFGCKHCGGVITIEPKLWSDHIDVRMKDAHPYEHSGTIQIRCKKCNKAVAVVAINQAK